MEKKRHAEPRVLLIPMYLKGHVDPLLFIAEQLMQHGIRVTIMIDRTITRFTHATALRFAEIFEVVLLDPLPEKRDKNGNPLRMGLMEASCTPYLENLVEEQKSGREIPTCIIADMFHGWVQGWARKLRLPWYSLFSSLASFGLVMVNVSRLLPHRILEVPNVPFSIPGISPVRGSDFPISLTAEPAFLAENGDRLRDATGILINTSYELEHIAIDALRVELGGMVKVLPIGPLLPPDIFSGLRKKSSSEFVQWLDTQEESSVIYIAFGSRVILSAPQVQELAEGLESSGVPFLWVLRCRSWTAEESALPLHSQSSVSAATAGAECHDLSSVLPPGFLSRTHGRGMVSNSLVPQLQVLSHPAIRGFLTHCGWNSSLESISTGVPLLAWPMVADQKFVCRFLVDVQRIALELAKEANGYVNRNEVERALRMFTAPSVWKDLKERIGLLQAQLQSATAEGGSSQQTIERFVKDIMEGR